MLTVSVAVTTFLALLLSMVWVLEGAGPTVDARVRALGSARRGRPGLAGVPFGQRVVVPAVEALGGRLAALLPGTFVRRTRRRLVLAGQPMSAGGFFALVVLLATLLGGGGLALTLAAYGGRPPPALLMLGAPLAALGGALPVLWLSSRARARQAALLRNLPDSLDLVTVCVEAGLSLDGALQQVVEKQSGPFVDELRQALHEIGLGKARRAALLDLAQRTDLDDVRSVTNAVIQTEELGTSLAPVMRAQTQRLRVRRRQRAEQAARRAPVKMVFPLVFCLMPSLFIFILGPVIVSVMEFLAGQ